MEEKTLSFGYGIRRSPSIGDEGELSECVNLIPKNGELVNIQPPKAMGITLDNGQTILYIHRTSNYVNYIYIDSNGRLRYKDSDNVSYDIGALHGTILKSISSVGNTLVTVTDEGIFYYLYNDSKYIDLGMMPEISLQCGLSGKPTIYNRESIRAGSDSEITIKYTIPWEKTYDDFSDDFSHEITDLILAKVNEFLEEYVRKQGRFVYPFLMRYAFRLFDGTLTKHSAPILMMPSTTSAPIAFMRDINVNDNTAYYDIFAVAAKIVVDAIYQTQLDELKNWTDIIKSVDLFVSSPIYTYDQSGQIKRNTHYTVLSSEFVGKLDWHDSVSYGWKSKAAIRDISSTYYQTWLTRHACDISRGGQPGYTEGTVHEIGVLPALELPAIDSSVVNKKIEETSVFYLLSSIDINDFLKSPHNRQIDVDEYYLDALDLKEVMTDDYRSHDNIIPDKSFVYNQRLNISGIKRELYQGYDVDSQCAYENGHMTYNSNRDTESIREDSPAYQDTPTFYTTIKEDGKSITVSPGASPRVLTTLFGRYFYYPNPDAQSFRIWFQENSVLKGGDLKQHTGLNGAYWFNGFATPDNISGVRPTVSTDVTVIEHNKIYTSEQGNPYVFPLGGINTIGTGEIMGMATVTKALSQGQFGQFPLYVFATDGVWAMEVSDAGLYSSIHPVSRDVCNNSKSITEIDDGIIFSTDRGLKFLQGSDIQLISGQMDGQNVDESIFNIVPEFSSLFVPDTEEFTELTKECTIAYDYSHALIHVFPKSGTKHFVYSLESNEFSTYVGYEVKAVVPDYPQNVVQLGNGLYTFDRYVSNEIRMGIAITRKVVFGSPFGLKLIQDMHTLMHKTSLDTKIRVGVFVSNDELHWFRLPSLAMRAFKYYRFVLFTKMTDIDTLTGTSMMVDTRRADKFR
jgi:hypothetical protein